MSTADLRDETSSPLHLPRSTAEGRKPKQGGSPTENHSEWRAFSDLVCAPFTALDLWGKKGPLSSAQLSPLRSDPGGNLFQGQACRRAPNVTTRGPRRLSR